MKLRRRALAKLKRSRLSSTKRVKWMTAWTLVEVRKKSQELLGLFVNVVHFSHNSSSKSIKIYFHLIHEFVFSGLEQLQMNRRHSMFFHMVNLNEMVMCLEDLINYFAQPEDDMGKEYCGQIWLCLMHILQSMRRNRTN